MKAVIQRVSGAKVNINGETYASISDGLLVLLGIKESDNQKTVEWMANKIVNLRIFQDENEKMNLSVQDIKGAIMIVSNFTIYGDVQKGFRPSFTTAGKPEAAEKIYDNFISYMKKNYEILTVTGIFGAMMDIELVNSGPVTIIVEKD